MSVFIVPVQADGVTVLPLTQANGENDFWQEFYEDVELPGDHLVGERNDSWAVVSQLLIHERNALGGGSAYFALGSHSGPGKEGWARLVQLAAARQEAGGSDHTRQLVAEAYVRSVVGGHLSTRVGTGTRQGVFGGPAGSMLKLYSAELHLYETEAAMELSGAAALPWMEGDSASTDGIATWYS